MSATRAHVMLQPGYVLHSRAYRDSSLLVELFTPQYGRVGVIARGARRANSQLQGVLQPFRPLLLSWGGRGELHSLMAAEIEVVAPWMRGQALMAGFYINELLMRLLHRHDPHPSLYLAYCDTMNSLATLADVKEATVMASVPLERALRLFEKRLLEEIGYGLVLDHDIDQGQPIDAQTKYVYDLSRGPSLARDGEGVSRRLTVRGQSLLDLAEERLEDSASLLEIKRLMRAALSMHLGDRPLMSRQLFMTRFEQAE